MQLGLDTENVKFLSEKLKKLTSANTITLDLGDNCLG